MRFINKIKNFFYDEEEVVEEEITKENTENVKRKKEVVKKGNEDISERELFKSERTFNFPMDIDDDEEDFSPALRSIKNENIVNTNTRIEKVENKVKQVEDVRKPYSYVKPTKKEEKKFKPTPVISPVFGILDENYKKEIVSNNLEKTREFNITRNTFDEIHRKAYGTPKVQEENKDDEEVKGLFYNLKDDSSETEDTDDIKITYNDVDYDSEDDEDIEVPKISRVKRVKEAEENNDNDDDVLSETKEQDLFNLIDNMYNSDEEDGDE